MLRGVVYVCSGIYWWYRPGGVAEVSMHKMTNEDCFDNDVVCVLCTLC